MQAAFHYISRQTSLWLLLPILCTGCSQGPTLHPVSGSVLQNDQPVKGVLVTFHPRDDDSLEVQRPRGLTGDDGKFTVLTVDRPGAPEGSYVLTFLCSQEVPPPAGKPRGLGMGAEYEDRFQGAYAEKSASKFHVDVKPGSNHLEPFRLK